MPRLLRSEERRSALLGAAPFLGEKGVSELLSRQRSEKGSALISSDNWSEGAVDKDKFVFSSSLLNVL